MTKIIKSGGMIITKWSLRHHVVFTHIVCVQICMYVYSIAQEFSYHEITIVYAHIGDYLLYNQYIARL